MPEDKQRIVGELKGQGFSVAKVGDGINDAPALAAADMIQLSKATMANIKQNMTVALGLKAVFLVTTVIG